MSTPQTTTLAELFGDPIHVTTRTDLLESGDLIDVTELATEGGFRVPVAMTRAAWTDAVAWTDLDEARKPQGTGQDETGRLWDVLTMARNAAARNAATSRVTFEVLRVPAEGRGVRARLTRLVLHIGPGDTTAPVITLLTPGED